MLHRILAILLALALSLSACKTWEMAAWTAALGAAAQATSRPGSPPPYYVPPYVGRPQEMERATILQWSQDVLVVKREHGGKWTLRPGLCSWTRLYKDVRLIWAYPRATLVGPQGETCACWVGERVWD